MEFGKEVAHDPNDPKQLEAIIEDLKGTGFSRSRLTVGFFGGDEKFYVFINFRDVIHATRQINQICALGYTVIGYVPVQPQSIVGTDDLV